MDTDAVVRKRARAVLSLLAATVAFAAFLLIGFEPDIQEAGARELVDREEDARAFLAADYVFILLYGVVSPIVIWRFAKASGGPAWMKIAALVLVVAGILDAVENTLLLSASDAVNEDAVDAAHGVAIPKWIFGLTAFALALGVNLRAIRTLRS